MIKRHKIKRSSSLYKKRKISKGFINLVLFIVVVAVLISLGFILSKKWANRFIMDKDNSSNIIPVTSAPVSSDTTSSTEDSNATEKIPSTIYTLNMPFTEYENKDETYITSYLLNAKSEGYNTVAVELKDDDGIIHYKTNIPLALECEAVSKNAVDLDKLVSIIKDVGLIPVAEISALKDKTAPSIDRGNSYAYSDNLDINWWDNSYANGGKPWLNPYMENTQMYLMDIATEIKNAGFNSIYLTNVMFPDKNTTDMNVIHETMSREDILKELVSDISEITSATYVYDLSDPLTAKEIIVDVQRKYELSIPLIKSTDFDELKPILDELEIDNYCIVR